MFQKFALKISSNKNNLPVKNHLKLGHASNFK